ncbi:hypothetical protein [Microbulbifer sp. TYP-18]|uniref:hypothetical protein n=1 Tax=Microbulbifer sp. TYP-18 TaxID=3230024 RepID=UPI0034C66F93
MKYILSIALFFACSVTSAESLTTDTYRVDIDPCKEGEVTCEPRLFIITELATGDKSRYLGTNVFAIGTDGKTPYHHQGYEVGAYDGKYLLYLDGKLEFLNKSGELVISGSGS